MVLAEEAQTRSLKIEAHRAAATALMRYERFAMSLSQCEMAIAIDPMDLSCLRMKGLLLIKLNRLLDAYQLLKDLTKKVPKDAEIWGLFGMVRKEQWISAWREPGNSYEEMREGAAYEEELLKQAIDAYERGFSLEADPYLGVSQLTLAFLHNYLIGYADNPYLDIIATKVRLSLLYHEHKDDYLSQALIADSLVLTGTPKAVEKAYKTAVTFAEDNWPALESSRRNLQILKDLGFNTENVEAALKVLDRALIKIKSANASRTPRRVFFFSGHAIDSPGRPEPRFPAIMEATAEMAIEEKLNELGAGPDDLALCAGSCGGDLLFAEACLQRGLRLEIRIPYEVSAFITSSVGWAGEQWVTRFYNVKNYPRTTLFTMPDELGQAPVSVNLWERNNLWQLYSALTSDAENVAFICLWNMQPSDGAGGVSHMHDLALNHSIDIHVLNIFNNYADAE
jgi:tetratricopeptide (TPR) repeat protein